MWRAPGRVNIIGEHIDYLGGLVLPFACDLELRIEAEPSRGEIVLDSVDLPGRGVVPLAGSSDPPSGWARHVWGVVRTLQQEGVAVRAVRGSIRSAVPVGAGLSSSAALEVAVALAVTGGRVPDPGMLARAEQLATGVPCGVMDQTTVLNGRAGHAILLDCRTRAFEHVPIDARIGFVVVDTGTRRELADGRYAQRRAEVEEAFARSGAPSLDEVDPSIVADRRLAHAVTEHARVREAVAALRSGDVEALGALVSASHASLRDDFEVSSRALDEAVEAAEAHPACTGARLVGAGFAGCVIAVVRGGREADVVAGLDGRRAWAVHAVGAAGELHDA